MKWLEKNTTLCLGTYLKNNRSEFKYQDAMLNILKHLLLIEDLIEKWKGKDVEKS